MSQHLEKFNHSLIPSVSLCQLGKTEAVAPRFRRRARQHESASSSSEISSDSSHSSRSTADSFLYGGLLEEEPATPIQSSYHTIKPTTANGNQDTRHHSQSVSGLGEKECSTLVSAKQDKQVKSSQMLGSDMVIVRPNKLSEEARVLPQNCSKPPLSTVQSGSDSAVLQLPTELQQLPHSDTVSLISDPHLSVSCCRVFKEDALLLVLLLSNPTEAALRDVGVELRCEELQVCYDRDCATFVTHVTENTLTHGLLCKISSVLAY